MRSIYPAGVLDVFLEAGFDPFERCYGVSSGALSLTSFLAGLHRRNYRILTRLAVQPEFIDLRRALRGGNVMDLDWLWDAMMEHEPLDARTSMPTHIGNRLFVSCTRVRDGQTMFFQPDESTWPTLSRATCALPLFYRKPVHFGGERWMDGAVSDPIPIARAIEDGAKSVLVIRTRHAEYRKRRTLEHRLARVSLSRRDPLRAVLTGLPERYNRSVATINRPPEGLEIHQVAPSRPLCTSRTTRNRDRLEADYLLGRTDAIAFLDRIGHPVGGSVKAAEASA